MVLEPATDLRRAFRSDRPEMNTSLNVHQSDILVQRLSDQTLKYNRQDTPANQHYIELKLGDWSEEFPGTNLLALRSALSVDRLQSVQTLRSPTE